MCAITRLLAERLRSGCRTVRTAVLACVAGAALAGPCEANEADWNLSGFGTLGAVYNGTGGTMYRRDITQSNGANGDQWSFAPDSMLGIQLLGRASPDWEAAVQVLSRDSVECNYGPAIAWAYLKFKPTPDSAVRAGRLGIEMYIQGDSVDIGYANLAVRPPIVFVPRYQDGADAETTLHLGEGTLRAKAMAGVADDETRFGPSVYDLSGSPFFGALADYQDAGWTLRLATGRLALHRALADASLQTLESALAQAQAPNIRQIDTVLALKGRRFDFLSSALAYDEGPAQAVASYTLLASDGWSRRNAFTLTGGYAIGAVTPYLEVYRTWTQRTTIPTGIAAGLSPATDALNQAAALAQGAGSKINECGLAIGTRFELRRDLALKLQIDRVRYLDPDNIVDPAQALQPYASRRPGNLELLSIALEFVF